MAKDRAKSDILSISPSSEETTMTEEIAIEALLNQRKELLVLVRKIDGDLESLGYVPNEEA